MPMPIIASKYDATNITINAVINLPFLLVRNSHRVLVKSDGM